MDTLFTDATASTPGTPLVAAWHNDANSVVYNTLASVAGADTITAVGPLSMTAYLLGQRFFFIPASLNSGATTININGLGAKAILFAGVALEANMLVPGHVAEIYYDGTNFQLMNSQTFPLSYATGTLPFSQVTGIVPVVQGGSGVSVAANAPWNPGRLLNVQIFATAGSATYTPTPGTNSVIIAAVGGGGGGGGAAATAAGTVSSGGGGMGGSWAVVYYATAIGSQSLTVGAAGAGGAPGGNGTSGGSTVVGTILTCPGGAPGQGIAAVAPPAFAAGGNSTSAPVVSGGGIYITGGGPGPGQPGHNPLLTAGNSGAGGTGLFGASGASPVYNNIGQAPFGNFGAGGSGAHRINSQGGASGGAGGAGRIVIYEYT